MKKLLTLILSVFLSTYVFAQDIGVMKDKISKTFPNLQIQSVEYIKNINLYEIKIKDNPKYAYTNNNLDYFIIDGEIIDAKNKSNYTKTRDIIKVQDFFNSLPFEKAIKVQYGNGFRKMAIFTDPDCPFCKALDQDIHANLKGENITIYYFMNPLPLPGHENSMAKAKTIMCSKDPSSSWIKWMTSNILPDNPSNCPRASNVDFTSNFSKTNGLNVTPVIIFDNGLSATSKISSEDIKAAFKQR